MKQYIKQIFEKKFNKNKPIIFFDRDGVLTKKSDFLLKKTDISFYKSAIKAIQLLNSNQFPIVVVTNQPAVARGWITPHHLIDINREIFRRLKKNNAFINSIYSCPHHPQADVLKYRIHCKCRKPGILMMEDAAKEFKVSINKCYLIGDQTTDIQAGKSANIKTFLVKTGYGGKDEKHESSPDYICTNALQAAKIILKDLNL